MTASGGTGAPLLQGVAERIVARYLAGGAGGDAQVVSTFTTFATRGIDVSYLRDGTRRTAKVKADPYFGTDTTKIGDRALSFYRADTGMLALEAVSDMATKQPGWMLESEADDLCYYYLVLGQTEDEVHSLLAAPDDAFFSELQVERDDLIIVPMREARDWFERSAEAYPPRPVFVGSKSAWYRLIPRDVLQSELPDVRIVGPVFASLVK